MNQSNPKTNILGILTLALALLRIGIGDGDLNSRISNNLPGVTAGIGLLAAKDNNR